MLYLCLETEILLKILLKLREILSKNIQFLQCFSIGMVYDKKKETTSLNYLNFNTIRTAQSIFYYFF